MWLKYCKCGITECSWDGDGVSHERQFFTLIRWSISVNAVLFLCICSFLIVPQLIYNVRNKISWSINQFPSDNLMKSVMFYGGYTNQTIDVKHTKHNYNIQQAYFLTIFTLYAVIFIIYSMSLARVYRKSLSGQAREENQVFAHKILFMWDYTIATKELAQESHKRIYMHMAKAFTAEKENQRNNKPPPFGITLNAILINVLVYSLIGLAALGFGNICINFHIHSLDSSSLTPLIGVCLINLGMIICRRLFKWISQFENNAEPIKSLLNEVIRIFVLELITVGTVIYETIANPHSYCWESELGYSVVLLILSDMLLDLICLPLMNLFRVLIVKYLNITNYKPQFEVVPESINIVYNQMLVWVGLPFAPILGGILLLKLLFAFYIKRAMLPHIYKKSYGKLTNSEQWQTILMIYSFISLLSMLLILGFIMTHIRLSSDCGPFRNYKFIFNFIVDSSRESDMLCDILSILNILVRPAIVGGILILLTVLVYYLRAKSRARYLMVTQLQKFMKLEISDHKSIVLNIIKIKNELNISQV